MKKKFVVLPFFFIGKKEKKLKIAIRSRQKSLYKNLDDHEIVLYKFKYLNSSS